MPSAQFTEAAPERGAGTKVALLAEVQERTKTDVVRQSNGCSVSTRRSMWQSLSNARGGVVVSRC